MKKIVTLFVAALAVFSGIQAQPRVSINVNIGTQPNWGPVGYDHVDYYYLPDIDVYYNVPERVYVYQDGNRWQRSANLPSRYRNIDLYRAHKVVINNIPEPYLRSGNYRKQYSQYRGRFDQVAIRDSREEKYYQNPGHPKYDQWNKQQAYTKNNRNDRNESKYDNINRNDNYNRNDNRYDNRSAQNNRQQNRRY